MKQNSSINAKIISFLLLISSILIAVGGFYYWKNLDNNTIRYQEVRSEKGSINITVLATGVVRPDNRLEIKPPIPGRVEQVLIKEGDKVKKGTILAWMSSTERAALLDAARSKGEAELKHWEKLYRATPVIAPITGTIILRNVESGQTFANNDFLFVMSDVLTVETQVDETDIAQIKKDTNAEFILDAYSNEKIEGVVARISYEAKTVNNVTTYIAEIIPKKIPEFMRSGMTANVTFLVESKQDVLLIPNEAIKMQDKQAIVLVKENNSNNNISNSDENIIAKERKITIGLTDKKKTEVLSGLGEGEIILIAKSNKNSKKQKSNNPFSPSGNGGNSKPKKT